MTRDAAVEASSCPCTAPCTGTCTAHVLTHVLPLHYSCTAPCTGTYLEEDDAVSPQAKGAWCCADLLDVLVSHLNLCACQTRFQGSKWSTGPDYKERSGAAAICRLSRLVVMLTPVASAAASTNSECRLTTCATSVHSGKCLALCVYKSPSLAAGKVPAQNPCSAVSSNSPPLQTEAMS